MSKVLMVASEAIPYAKTGGLADVIGALPFALQEWGHQVSVVLPLFRTMQPQLTRAERIYDNLPATMGTGLYSVDLRRINDRGVNFYFVDCPALFDRAELYGEAGQDYTDNHIRFGVLCRSVFSVIRYFFRPDILHLHDWQAALAAPYLKTFFAGDPTFYGIKTLLTIHNLGYQGLFPRSALGQLQLPDRLFHPDLMEFYGQVNLLKGGIVFADELTTVSRGYAREIQTAEYGFGLDGLLRARANVLTGIVNGVDYSEWSPDHDPYTVAPYDSDHLAGKRKCKADLLREFGLPSANLDRPLIGIVSRFVGQKGFDLIEEIQAQLMEEDLFLVGIGTGEPRYEQALSRLAGNYPDRVGIRIAYSDALAHKIEAGADIFLMPSRYEPCGLNQIYSLRYGAVPVVRATGGLDDTIEAATGFKFQEYSGTALLGSIRDALTAYRDRSRWTAMMKTGMRKDFSWASSAAEYSAVFQRLTAESLGIPSSSI